MDLLEHNFYKSLMGYLTSKTDVYDENTNEVYEVELWDTNKNYLAYNYLINVIDVYNNFKKNFEEIMLSEYFIKNCELFYTEKELSVKVEYFVKNWILRIASQYDILISAINEILQLGYLGRTVTINNIENNKYVTDDKNLWRHLINIRKVIDVKVLKQTKKLFQLNNEIKHTGNFAEDLILDIGLIELEHLFSKSNKLDLIIDTNLVKNKLYPDIESTNKLLYDNIVIIFDYLEVKFEEKFNGLLIDKF